ncbi:hypothetical protein [Chryseobacterium turcicum]|uniref:WG repeat-containing protein n=1 Tax=Chryseobacterium turcicum TaxID=2898076 RepID=A0A9Q3V0H4_9FLAO|nr:hypothetical protein [Chryseobacterium turcicum]MCD1115493.1 hypothetical protein [Chryseobacterium turcicum]
MKKIFLIVLSCMAILSFSQATEAIKFKGNISRFSDITYKGFKVLDQRQDKSIGMIPFGENKEMKEVVFPTTPQNDFKAWYDRGNTLGGNNELVLILKRLKLSTGESDGKKTLGKMDFSAQIFQKEGDKYKFLYKKDTVFTFQDKEVSELMVKNIPTIFSIFIKKAYTLEPIQNAVTLNDLSDYELFRKSNYEAFKNEQLKDGVYLDFTSFFNQSPVQGNYVLEKNDKGEVVKAIKVENGKKEKISTYKMFSYVENGKAYKKTMSGFIEINKNENGFYIIANRGDIFQAQYSNTYGMFGLIGVVAGSIDQAVKQKKMKNNDKKEIYIDPLTGEYDFS